VTRYWIENYFRRPEYLRVADKPLVIVFSTDRLTANLGGARVKEAFSAMRAECRRAGLPGLYLMAGVADAGQAAAATKEGYDAVTAYNWPGLGSYDVPAWEPRQTAWDFAQGIQGWEQTMDMANLRLAEHALSAETIGADPAFFGPPMRARPGQFSTYLRPGIRPERPAIGRALRIMFSLRPVSEGHRTCNKRRRREGTPPRRQRGRRQKIKSIELARLPWPGHAIGGLPGLWGPGRMAPGAAFAPVHL
jgi:hypothetical protein